MSTPLIPLARGQQVMLGAAGPLISMLLGVGFGADRTGPLRLGQIDLTAALLIPLAAITFAVCVWRMTRPGARKLATGMFWFLGLLLGTVLTAAAMLGAAVMRWVT